MSKTSCITGPLFKWFGSKWLASKHYPAPRYHTIYEPFAGSASYALRHGDGKSVIIAERNTLLRELWKWLINDATGDCIKAIPLNLAEGIDIRTLGMSRGQSLLLKHWQRTNNVGDCWTVSPWGNKPGQWTANTRARVAEEVYAVKHWTILGDAFATMELPDSRGSWFIDPPYQFNYDYKTKVNYRMLAEHVKRLDGQVIVCEALCPVFKTAPTYLDFKPFRDVVTSRRKSSQNHHSKELMYYRNE